MNKMLQERKAGRAAFNVQRLFHFLGLVKQLRTYQLAMHNMILDRGSQKRRSVRSLTWWSNGVVQAGVCSGPPVVVLFGWYVSLR